MHLADIVDTSIPPILDGFFEILGQIFSFPAWISSGCETGIVMAVLLSSDKHQAGHEVEIWSHKEMDSNVTMQWLKLDYFGLLNRVNQSLLY